MKFLKPALTVALLACSTVCTNAWAQHGHGGGHVGGHVGGGHYGGHYGGGHYYGHGGRFGLGVVVGAPLFWPGWYGPPYYDPYYYPEYYSPPVIVTDPPVYVERSAPAAQSQSQSQSSTWSYCAKPAGYYPYVKQCDVPWRTVDPATVPPPR